VSLATAARNLDAETFHPYREERGENMEQSGPVQTGETLNPRLPASNALRANLNKHMTLNHKVFLESLPSGLNTGLN